MDPLRRIKLLLGIDGYELDEKLMAIVDITKERLLLFLDDAEEVPQALSYIVDEVSIERFNRIGSEGLRTHGVEGESMTWNDSDFKPYMDDIHRYLTSKKAEEDGLTAKGKVHFI